MLKSRMTLAAFAALATTGVLAGCGSSSESGATSTSTTSSTSSTSAAASGISCDKAGDLAATPAQKPPTDLPLVAGGHVYMAKGPFGKTSLFFAWVKADPTDLNSTRDDAAATLEKAGYKIERKDQEEGSEAEAHLTGPHDVAIQVIQLCQDRVRVKYTVS